MCRMSERPIKTKRLQTPYARAVLRVEKTWEAPCVLLGSSPTDIIQVYAPKNVVIPLSPGAGRRSRELAARSLRRVAGFPVDLFVVEVSTPAGVQGYGMVAVPQAVEPRFFLEKG